MFRSTRQALGTWAAWKKSELKCWDFLVCVISYIYTLALAASSSSVYSKEFHSCQLHNMNERAEQGTYATHPLTPGLCTASSTARPANCCLCLIIPNITGTSLVVWSKFRISPFLYVSLWMATDGSVLCNVLLQKVRAMKVYAYTCEKYVNVKCKLDWLDQITQSLPQVQ